MAKITGTVGSGRKIGRQLGFPTANIELSENVDIPDGVYAVRVTDGVSVWNGMANLGRRPTVSSDGHRRVLEVNLFDFTGNLYGRRLEVEMLQWFRPEENFATLEELQERIADDRRRIEEYFKNL